MSEYVLLLAFLFWYDRLVICDIVATIVSAVVALVMVVLSTLCFISIIAMLPANIFGRTLLGHDTRLWTGNVVNAIMGVMKPIERKVRQ